MRKNRVVPLAVEGGSLKPNSRHLARTHLDADRILPRIESRLDTQPRRRAGTTNEADDHLAAQQGLSPPVRSDMAKHTMLDLVPFARARREMAYRYMQPRLIGEPLQLCLPQPRTGTLLPPPSAVMSSSLARGYMAAPIWRHHARIVATANAAVSWSTPTLTHPRLAPTS